MYLKKLLEDYSRVKNKGFRKRLIDELKKLSQNPEEELATAKEIERAKLEELVIYVAHSGIEETREGITILYHLLRLLQIHGISDSKPS